MKYDKDTSFIQFVTEENTPLGLVILLIGLVLLGSIASLTVIGYVWLWVNLPVIALLVTALMLVYWLVAEWEAYKKAKDRK